MTRANQTLKVGELAKRAGVSVRALHHYEEIGLLIPSSRSPAGYRLYCANDIARLQQIRSLQQIGFSLDDIKTCLKRDDFSPRQVIELHLKNLRQQIELEKQLAKRLELLAARLDDPNDNNVTILLQILEDIAMLEKYYTPEQLDELKQRGEMVGEQRMREVEAEWRELFDKVRAAMQAKQAPASEPVQQLARKWQSLIDEFTGGKPDIEHSLGEMYRHEGPAIGRRHGFDFDPEMFAFMGQALDHLKNKDV